MPHIVLKLHRKSSISAPSNPPGESYDAGGIPFFLASMMGLIDVEA